MSATQSQPKARKHGAKPPVVRDRVLRQLAQEKTGTSVTLSTAPGYLPTLVDLGYVQPAGQVSTGKRGRPALAYKLTRKGAGRARTVAKRAA